MERARPERLECAEPMRVHLPAAEVDVVIKRSAAARRMTLRLPHGQIEPVLTIPAQASFNSAARFLDAQQTWLRKQLGKRRPRVALEPDAVIPLRGVPHRIRHRPDMRGAAWVAEQAGEHFLCVTGKAEHLHRRAVDALRRFARQDLEAAVMRSAAVIGRRPKAIRVRDTRSQWGSCSAAGILSFSWRLVLAPPFVLDYVAAHEVAHLVEMNHGRSFWRLTGRLCPGMEDARRWLKAEGPALHAIGVGGPRRLEAADLANWTGGTLTWPSTPSSKSSSRSSGSSSSAI